MGITAAICSAEAVGANYFEPCRRQDQGYEEHVERRFREAWPNPIETLIIQFGGGLRTEAAVGLSYDDSGFSLVRLEFDRSFFYGSRVDRYGTRRYDFSQPQVRVATMSVPVSSQLATAFDSAISRTEAADESEESRIVLDGSHHEIVTVDSACVVLRNPPKESPAGRLVELFEYLDGVMKFWRPNLAETLETEILTRIAEVWTSE